MKRVFLTALILFSTLQAYALEDYILSTDGRLNNITVENKEIIKIQPLITIDNSKNTLFITPLKQGETRFCVTKNEAEKHEFSVRITEDKAIFSKVSGFEIVAFDTPPVIWDFQLDLPPMLRKKDTAKEINIDGATVDTSILNKNEGEEDG